MAASDSVNIFSNKVLLYNNTYTLYAGTKITTICNPMNFMFIQAGSFLYIVNDNTAYLVSNIRIPPSINSGRLEYSTLTLTPNSITLVDAIGLSWTNPGGNVYGLTISDDIYGLIYIK